jgi:hypothetical protein
VPIENCIKGKLYRLSVEELRNRGIKIIKKSGIIE